MSDSTATPRPEVPLDRDLAVVRLYVATWRFTSEGAEVTLSTAMRVLDALERIEVAAKADR